jgi:hypothetical protein
VLEFLLRPSQNPPARRQLARGLLGSILSLL